LHIFILYVNQCLPSDITQPIGTLTKTPSITCNDIRELKRWRLCKPTKEARQEKICNTYFHITN